MDLILKRVFSAWAVLCLAAGGWVLWHETYGRGVWYAFLRWRWRRDKVS